MKTRHLLPISPRLAALCLALWLFSFVLLDFGVVMFFAVIPSTFAVGLFLGHLVKVARSFTPESEEYMRPYGSLEWVDPKTLKYEGDLWDGSPVGDLSDLARSISTLGVISPLTGYRNAFGEVIVLVGHRRMLAACVAGLEEIPVFVLNDQCEAGGLAVQVADGANTSKASTLAIAKAVDFLKEMRMSKDRVAELTGVNLDRQRRLASILRSAHPSFGGVA